MDVYVARQPIFDRQMNLYGYELLYRKSDKNCFEKTDDRTATASVLENSFFAIGFDELTCGTRGFINFSSDLLKNGVAELLPKDKIVVEILERVVADDSVVAACKKLKTEGYTLALDDFILKDGGGGCAPLIGLADIIKIEFPFSKPEDQLRLMEKFRGRVSFLAEKVETVEQYRQAVSMGYRLFQGYFFSRPVMMKAKDISSLDSSLILVMKELRREEPDFRKVSEIIEKDVGLSYRLLKMANSVFYGAHGYRIKSIPQALVQIGAKPLLQWIQLSLLKGMQTHENSELVKTCAVRGRLLAEMADKMGKSALESDYFIVGIFSSLDQILGTDMESVVKSLSLSGQASDALLGRSNELRRCLDAVLALEQADWKKLSGMLSECGVPREEFMQTYLDAIKWQQTSM